MLLLVLANSYLGLYVGWEGVGLASYLLISYYYDRNRAATAGNKAFFANRVGDVGLSIAIMLMFAYLGSTSYARGDLRRAGTVVRPRCRDRTDAAARRLRQVGTVPVADLAAGRDGGPDPGVGADPCGNHGHRRCLPDRALGADLRPVAGRPHGRRDHRRDHAALRLHQRLRAGRPQAGARELDRQPDRLHVPRGRARPRRLRDRHHPPARARLLQGRAVPLGRLGDARDERPNRHAALRRTGPGHADHLRACSCAATSRSSASRARPASSRRTRSSRLRSTRAARPAGSSASARCSARASPRST